MLPRDRPSTDQKRHDASSRNQTESLRKEPKPSKQYFGTMFQALHISLKMPPGQLLMESASKKKKKTTTMVVMMMMKAHLRLSELWAYVCELYPGVCVWTYYNLLYRWLPLSLLQSRISRTPLINVKLVVRHSSLYFYYLCQKVLILIIWDSWQKWVGVAYCGCTEVI